MDPGEAYEGMDIGGGDMGVWVGFKPLILLKHDARATQVSLKVGRLKVGLLKSRSEIDFWFFLIVFQRVELREKKIKNALRPARTPRRVFDFFLSEKTKKCVYNGLEWSPEQKKIQKKHQFFYKNSYKTCILVLSTYFEGTLTFKTYKNW